jgi:hypothetical protein
LTVPLCMAHELNLGQDCHRPLTGEDVMREMREDMPSLPLSREREMRKVWRRGSKSMKELSLMSKKVKQLMESTKNGIQKIILKKNQKVKFILKGNRRVNTKKSERKYYCRIRFWCWKTCCCSWQEKGNEKVDGNGLPNQPYVNGLLNTQQDDSIGSFKNKIWN